MQEYCVATLKSKISQIMYSYQLESKKKEKELNNVLQMYLYYLPGTKPLSNKSFPGFNKKRCSWSCSWTSNIVFKYYMIN